MNKAYKLKQWHEDLWTVDAPFKLFGVSFGNRMTVMRSRNQLLLHSPVKYNDELAREISTLGEISHLISPNLMHYVHMEAWRNAFPRAELIAPANSKISPGKVLNGETEAELERQYQQNIKIIAVQGAPKLKEYAFIHLPSKTLVFTDLAFNIHDPLNMISNIFFKAYGAYEKFGPTRLIQMMVQEPDKFQKSLRDIGQYDFDRVIVSHGRIVETGGKQAFEKAFSQQLD
jgi:hypothetical protein